MKLEKHEDLLFWIAVGFAAGFFVVLFWPILEFVLASYRLQHIIDSFPKK